MRPESYLTPGGISVSRTMSKTSYARGLSGLLRKLDTQRGIYLSSGYEYPGRYSRWDVAAVAPPVEIAAAGREIIFHPLNERGKTLNRILEPLLAPHPHWDRFLLEDGVLKGTLKPLPALFPEEQRSKQPSALSILRSLLDELRHPLGSRLALAGAFGYDLLFQFDPIELKLPRNDVRDLRLFFCDDIYFMDRKKEQIERFQYDFSRGELTTAGMARTAARVPRPKRLPEAPIVADHTPEEYMANVETVREGMRRGDFYEVVLRQTFRVPYSGTASGLFEKIQQASPSPYQFLLQFGDEQLIGASPEMFVRVEGKRVETCPISGTARRTGDPLKDAENIRELLNSAKEESELTMCSDVDRNDKSRVCEPGSVRVIGRRLIESYAGLFHTVDHVQGTLADGFDSLDAFLTHMWAVTIIGAPKKWAAQAIEDLEKTARGWYGGAVGMIAMDGDINTGITIRTVHLRDGIAKYGAGATLLYDSVPVLEEAETRLKATGFFRALNAAPPVPGPYVADSSEAADVRLLLVDNEDCFIHTLANYARQTGAEVMTYRAGFPLHLIQEIAPSLQILVSPRSTGRPERFWCARADPPRLRSWKFPLVFGVCLGIARNGGRAFGGELGVALTIPCMESFADSPSQHRRISRIAGGISRGPLLVIL